MQSSSRVRVRQVLGAIALLASFWPAASCGENPPDTAETDPQVTTYAIDIVGWWASLAGTDAPLAVTFLDSDLVLRAEAAGELEPEVPVPPGIETEHALLLSSIADWAHADAAAAYRGLNAGVAAAFCDPRTSGLSVSAAEIVRLQLWRSGAGCRDRDRWGGNFVEKNSQLPPEAEYTWGCENLVDLRSDFDTENTELALACGDLARAKSLLDGISSSWARRLRELCGNTNPQSFESMALSVRQCGVSSP
jgi:hypothetical protein